MSSARGTESGSGKDMVYLQPEDPAAEDIIKKAATAGQGNVEFHARLLVGKLLGGTDVYTYRVCEVVDNTRVRASNKWLVSRDSLSAPAFGSDTSSQKANMEKTLWSDYVENSIPRLEEMDFRQRKAEIHKLCLLQPLLPRPRSKGVDVPIKRVTANEVENENIERAEENDDAEDSIVNPSPDNVYWGPDLQASETRKRKPGRNIDPAKAAIGLDDVLSDEDLDQTSKAKRQKLTNENEEDSSVGVSNNEKLQRNEPDTESFSTSNSITSQNLPHLLSDVPQPTEHQTPPPARRIPDIERSFPQPETSRPSERGMEVKKADNVVDALPERNGGKSLKRVGEPFDVETGRSSTKALQEAWETKSTAPLPQASSLPELAPTSNSTIASPPKIQTKGDLKRTRVAEKIAKSLKEKREKIQTEGNSKRARVEERIAKSLKEKREKKH